jgi:hypothetical protein
MSAVVAWLEKIWKSIFPSTNIDDYPVVEERVMQISHRVPQTAWGRELMTDAWPKLYESGLTSETYLGCVAVLLTLTPHLRQGMTLKDIEQKVTAIDQSLKNSKLFVPGSDRAGGALLAVTNAWQRTHAGLSAEQLLIAFDSELIYAAKMFIAARAREKEGEKLR